MASYGGGVPAPDGQSGSHRGRTPGQQHSRRQGTGNSPGANALRKQNRRLRKRLKRVRRARRRDNRMSITAPLTDRRLAQEIGAAQDIRYGGELRNLGNQIRGSERRQNVEIPAWMQHFNNVISQARDATTAAYAGAQQAQLGATGQGFERTQGVIDQQQAQAQQQAQVRGSTPDMQPFMDARTAAGFTQAQGQMNAGALGREGGIATEHMAMQQLIGAQKMLEALQSESRREGVLRDERRGVLAERGQYGVDLRRELRGDERQWQAIMQEFGLDQATLAANVADDRADNRLNRQKERRQARADRRTAARNRLLNASTREDIRKKRGQRALDRNADLADDGRRNYSTNYSEWAQRTRPNKGDGKGGPPKYAGSKTNVPQGERRQNQRSFRAMIRRVRAGQPVTGSPDPLLTKAAAQFIYWEKRGAPGVTSQAMRRKLWKEYGIKVPVTSKQHPGSKVPRNPDGTPG